MDCLLDKNEQIKKICKFLIKNKYVVILILVNFIANFLFIFQYKFYSDDWVLIVGNPWTAPYGYYFLNSERQIYYVILKFQAQIFQDNALIYHILGFITTSLLLILIYKIAKKIFSDFNYSAEIYPFLAAVIYCVLFNKDELYPWALLALSSFSIMYMISFYAYINKEKPHYLGYSLIAYTLGLFTYELGIALPVIFLSYDVLLKKDYKKSFLFAIPLVFNLLVRKTSWFGYGTSSYSRGFGEWGFQNLLSNTFDFLSASIFMMFRQILYGLQGLQTLGSLLIIITLLNLILLFVLYKMLNFDYMPQAGNIYLGFLLVIITAAFAFPFILRGGLLSGSLPTRSFEFIDIGIAFLLTFIVGYLSKFHVMKLIVLLFIGLSIFLCQGLYMNWVVSGNIQEDVYHFISEHSSDIKSYDYVYFNTTSYIINKPNAIDESIFYPIAKIYFQYLRNDPQALEQRIKTQTERKNNSNLYNEYDRYYNAKALDNYVLLEMLAIKVGTFNTSNLIYGKSQNVPLEISNEYIIFQNPYPNGQNFTVNKSCVFEISYRSIPK